MAWVETRSCICSATGSTSNQGFSRFPLHSIHGSCCRNASRSCAALDALSWARLALSSASLGRVGLAVRSNCSVWREGGAINTAPSVSSARSPAGTRPRGCKCASAAGIGSRRCVLQCALLRLFCVEPCTVTPVKWLAREASRECTPADNHTPCTSPPPAMPESGARESASWPSKPA